MNPRMLLTLARYDLKARYAGSVLGVLWCFAEPVVLTGIYWFVYMVALGGGYAQDSPYFLWLMAGMAPWCFFAQGLCSCAGCFWDYAYLVKKTGFPMEVLPLIRVLSAGFVHFFFAVVVWGVTAVWNRGPHAGQLWLLVYMPLLLVFTFALGRVCALLCTRVRDVSAAVNVAVQLGFWITPVFWQPGALPDGLGWMVGLNPVATLIQGYRGALLGGALPSPGQHGWMLAAVVLLLVLGEGMMRRMRPTLADRL